MKCLKTQLKTKIFFSIFSLFLLTSCKNTVINIEETWEKNTPAQIQEDVTWKDEETKTESIKTPTIVYDEISLPTLMQQEIIGNDLKLENILSDNQKYTRYRISYKNGDILLSGIMNIPKWEWPFPLLVLNHGYIDTRYYTNGRGLKREQNHFANNGFAVIHPDYRNHAFSDKISEQPYDFRLGYTTDVIAAVYAVQESNLAELESIDSSKVWMLGHSMWGWISQNISVVAPDLIDALVLYGPVSNNEYKNFEKFQMWNTQRSIRVKQVLSDHGSQEENPLFWDGVSSKTFFDNINAPVSIFTGTSDKDTPTQWAEDIAQDLRDRWKSVELISYTWEWHEFWPKWNDFMEQSTDFFRVHLK